MNFDIISLIIFYGIIIFLFFRYRHKFTMQGKIVALYKTKFGLKLMDKLPKLAPRLFHLLGWLALFLGYAGMIFIFIILIKETFTFLITPGAIPPLAPVLPGVQIPGAPKLSFWHWIISIFIVAVVHEFSHGIFARLYKIKIKSSGFAIFGPILGAFVEPDEKQLKKAKKHQQLAVFAAGPFANIIFGILFLLLLNFVVSPMLPSYFEPAGLQVNSVLKGYPMELSGIETPFVIKEINGMSTQNFTEFLLTIAEIKPGDELLLKTDKGEYNVVAAENPLNKSIGYLGISNYQTNLEVREKYASYGKLPLALIWINILLLWLFLINLGVGLFNLLPLGPLDGGRMFLVSALALTKSEKKATWLLGLVSIICLILIVVNLLPWLIKLLVFLGNFLMLILA
ncbi:MAG: site-2 protease family protein [Nanoarchaeota archaeon]|nr:site-2 protease family protein [Nanoarchaeota archaeon]MBU4352027.1 site-2 protease family protein [Nanoarchaeota archaeon]MBU4456510.1 site-2 protease family protein [Nanoarchaeota archaeon]MCG2719314.1 site-2 protease family protein [Nanoarchaeota archaeon]